MRRGGTLLGITPPYQLFVLLIKYGIHGVSYHMILNTKSFVFILANRRGLDLKFCWLIFCFLLI